ncbi:MAG: polysaccharide deacetylase family protein [Bacteroidota bacterium]
MRLSTILLSLGLVCASGACDSPTSSNKEKSTEKEMSNYTTWAEKLGYPKDKTILILHADDIGMCPEANISAKNYLEKGEITSAAVMMPCPNAEEFILWAKEHPEHDIGMHLTLTSEWKTYRWASITDPKEVPGLIDEEGKLYHEVVQVVQHASAEEVEKEIRAQIEKSISLGLMPSHMDTHMGTLYGSPAYTAAYTQLAMEYNIPAMVLDVDNPAVIEEFRSQGYPMDEKMIQVIKDYTLPKLDFFAAIPAGKTYEEKRENFFKLIESIPPGLAEVIFHPSEHTENLKSITNSWQERNWEAEMFADEKVKNFLSEQGVILTNWKEIMERFEKMEK